MPPPRAPSRIDLITFPAFASSWLGIPSLPPSNAGGLSILAYSGGGGSAKTGVFNLIDVSSAYQLADDERDADANADEYGVVKNEFRISTGDEVGVGVAMFRPHNAKKGEGALLAAAVGNEIRVYRVPINPDDMPGGDAGVGSSSGDEKENAKHLLMGSVHVGDGFGCNAVSWSPTGNAIAVGCENGRVRVYMLLPATSSGTGGSSGSGPSLELKLASDCEGHEKAVCSVSYHPRGGAVLSSAKDGTARIWDVRGDSEAGTELAQLKCSIEGMDGKSAAPKNRRPPQILVRGCAFGDLEGKVVFTVASGRRGSAYLSKWKIMPGDRPQPRPAPTPGKPPLTPAKSKAIQSSQQGPRLKVTEEVRLECHPMPVSAVSLSGDASHLALGGVDGTVTYLKLETMKPTKKWMEIHDLPVTCIAARPTHLPLPGEEEEGINVDIMSASADNRLSKLTLQRRSRRKNRDGSGGGGGIAGFGLGMLGFLFSLWFLFFCMAGVILAILTQLSWEACEAEISSKDIIAAKECIWSTVLWAPSDRPGVSFPPH
mmetsp:Transcript_12892/g.36780  ORF Transcript_12892/g.36780 Transcript_12892/m.36780 type:complete len:543 (-) Transcript_12892:107-1735(-)